MTTKAAPQSAGRLANSFSSASRPPAEAPMATTYRVLAGGWGGVSVSVGRGATLAGGVAAVIGLGVGRLLGMGLVNRSGGYNPGLYAHHADGRLNPTILPAFATSESAMFLFGWSVAG